MRKRSSKTTKRAMTTSIISILLCLAMFVGATFAWFTDTASTNVNKIEAGTLDVQLLNADGTAELGKEPLKWVKKSGTDEVLWEPGVTYNLESFQIKNAGNLALKYQVQISGLEGDAELLNAIDFYVKVGNGDQTALGNLDGTLEAGKSTGVITITGKMRTDAGNTYQGKKIDGIAITVFATQKAYEYDSNGNTYDSEAKYNLKSVTFNGETTTLDNNNTYKIGEATLSVSEDGAISYTNSSGAAQTVSITTSSGQTLTVDATGDTINHYGKADNVIIKAINNNSFHEFGKVDVLEIEKGRVVVENGNNIATIQVKSTDNNAAPIIAVPQGVVLETKPEVEYGKTVEFTTIDNQGNKIEDTSVKFTNSNDGASVEKAIPTELKQVLDKDKNGKVKVDEPKEYKVMIGNTGYENLNAAISADDSTGKVIKLIDNISLDSLTIDKAITIDLNGKTLTVNGETCVSENGALTIQDSGENGQFVLGENGIKINKGKLVLNIETFNDDIVNDGGTVEFANKNCIFSGNYTVVAYDLDTFAAALKDEKVNTVKLGQDITIGTGRVEVDHNITVDFNSKTLKAEGSWMNNQQRAIDIDDGKLIFMDSSADKNGKFITAYGGIKLWGESTTFELNDITIECAKSYAIQSGWNANNATAIMNGGKISGGAFNLSNGDNCSVIVNNGTIEETSPYVFTGIYVGYSNVTINDGVFTGSGNPSIINSGANVPGALTINGGTFTTTGKWPYNKIGSIVSSSQKAIKGGTFNVDPTSLVADGYKANQNADGNWVVTAQ